MKRRGREEEACGVWLDAAALKRRKVQTHLVKPSIKMLTLFPGERKPKISSTQRTIPSAGIRQTSIASFFTLQSGKTNGGDKRNVSSLIENQDNRDSKALNQPNHPVQGMGGDCMAPSVATPADVHEAGVSPQFLHASGHYRTGTPFLTVLQPDTLACTGESKVSPNACSSTRDLESSCALPQKEGENSFQKREWLHQSKNMNCEGVERHIKHPGCKDHQLLDRTELEKVSAKENRQDPVLSAYRDSWGGKHTGSVKHSPCPIPVFTCDSENSDKDCWSQLFTEDSQGQQVIAHKSRPPFRDVSNNQNQGLGQFPNNTRPHCQDVSTQLNLQPDLLFTQDSEGNQVIRHQVGMYL